MSFDEMNNNELTTEMYLFQYPTNRFLFQIDYLTTFFFVKFELRLSIIIQVRNFKKNYKN
jgi:hypothetical protein